jgi:hypothetical protein
MLPKIPVGLAILLGLATPIEARAQALSESVVSITNATVSTVNFSLGSADDGTQKWIDASLKRRQTKAYKVWANTRLRIAVTSGGFRIIRYFAVSPGERYRIGVDNKLYDLRRLHARDQGETKLTPVKEEKEAVIPTPPKDMPRSLYLPNEPPIQFPAARSSGMGCWNSGGAADCGQLTPFGIDALDVHPEKTTGESLAFVLAPFGAIVGSAPLVKKIVSK